MKTTFAVFCCFVICATHCHAEDWPQWRGPKLNNISDGNGFVTEFDSEKNVKWKVELPGPAGASPVIAGDRIFLTSLDGKDLVLMCFSKEGKELWSDVIATGNRNARGDEGNFASPSPCTDGKHVWAMMGSGELVCYSVDGKQQWKKDLEDEYGNFDIQFGMTSTPVLYKGTLYLQLIHGEFNRDPSRALVVAIDAASGKEKWKKNRDTEANMENKHSYASPIIYEDDEKQMLITHGADYVIAHSLKDGSEIWRCGGLQRQRYNPYLRLVASPVCSEGLIVVPSAKNGPVLGLKGSGSGDITGDERHQHWKYGRNTPDVPTPVIHNGLVYMCRENGVVICLDAKSGEKIYEERLESDRYRASPVYADGHLYITSRRGIVSVIKAGREFELVSENEMGEQISASPAFSDGVIYLRSFDHLYAIGK